MAQDDIRAVLGRVLTWPARRQDEVVEILTTLDELHTSPYQLTEEQVAQVRRRQAEDNLNTVPFEDAFKRFQSSS